MNVYWKNVFFIHTVLCQCAKVHSMEVRKFRPDSLWYYHVNLGRMLLLTCYCILAVLSWLSLTISCSKDPGYIKRPMDSGSYINTEVGSVSLKLTFQLPIKLMQIMTYSSCSPHCLGNSEKKWWFACKQIEYINLNHDSNMI